MKKYSIILDEKEIARVIPSKWLTTDKKAMYWPPLSNKVDINDSIIKLNDIGSDWTKYCITYIKSNDSYVDAVSESKMPNLNKLTDASDEEKIKKSRSVRHKKSIESINTLNNKKENNEPPKKISKTNILDSESDSNIFENGSETNVVIAVNEKVPLSLNVAKIQTKSQIKKQNTSVVGVEDDDIEIPVINSTELNNANNDSYKSISNLQYESIDTMTDREVLIANHELLIKLLQKSNTHIIKITKLETKLQSIKSKNSINEIINLTVEDTVLLEKYLPVDIIEDSLKKMERVEDMLKDKSYFKKVVHYLKSKGGNDLKKLIYNMMSAVLTNKVANDYSFTGRKGGKKCFSQLRFCNCIYQACK